MRGIIRRSITALHRKLHGSDSDEEDERDEDESDEESKVEKSKGSKSSKMNKPKYSTETESRARKISLETKHESFGSEEASFSSEEGSYKTEWDYAKEMFREGSFFSDQQGCSLCLKNRLSPCCVHRLMCPYSKHQRCLHPVRKRMYKNHVMSLESLVMVTFSNIAYFSEKS